MRITLAPPQLDGLLTVAIHKLSGLPASRRLLFGCTLSSRCLQRVAVSCIGSGAHHHAGYPVPSVHRRNRDSGDTLPVALLVVFFRRYRQDFQSKSIGSSD